MAHGTIVRNKISLRGNSSIKKRKKKQINVMYKRIKIITMSGAYCSMTRTIYYFFKLVTFSRLISKRTKVAMYGHYGVIVQQN